MAEYSVYQDIAERTGGSCYLGIVGPVRTGKSTFIKRCMETLVIPNITDANERERARDEMPQSAQGKTVMTTEPKFIPDEAVEISLDDACKTSLRVKMVDCVGYIVPGALGNYEDGQPRMVHTPWSEEPMPFDEAAEIGTQKVINEHATIGVMVTTDGTIGEIPRGSYIEAEKRIVSEMKALKKPFVILLNSAEPESEEARRLADELEDTYSTPVALVNCLTLTGDEIRRILELVLYEFPITEISVNIPQWLTALSSDHPLIRAVNDIIAERAGQITKTGDVRSVFCASCASDDINEIKLDRLNLGDGRATLTISLRDGLFYQTIGEETGFEITDEHSLISLLKDLTAIKKEYEKVEEAIRDVERKGYGIVMPEIEDLSLEEPEIVKQHAGYGVKLKASAPSIHMIKAKIEAEVSPIVGTEQQSEEIIKHLLTGFEEDPKKIWETNMFGKSLYELINDGLHTKLAHMPDDARSKLAETVERIINEGSGGLICILL